MLWAVVSASERPASAGLRRFTGSQLCSRGVRPPYFARSLRSWSRPLEILGIFGPLGALITQDLGVLVLDEATSALDTRTERAVKEALDETRERTRHAELLALGGKYAALAAASLLDRLADNRP